MIPTLVAIIGMAAVGWIAWRLVNSQSEVEGMDEQDEKLRERRQQEHAARMKARKGK